MGRESGLRRRPVDSFPCPPNFPFGTPVSPTLHPGLSTSLFLTPNTLFSSQFLLTDAQALLKSLGFPVPLALDRDFRPHNKSYYGSLNYQLLQDRRPRLFVGDTTECCYSLPYVPGPSSLVAVGSQEEVESCPQPHPLAKVFRESFRCQMPETQDSRPGFPRQMSPRSPGLVDGWAVEFTKQKAALKLPHLLRNQDPRLQSNPSSGQQFPTLRPSGM